MNKETKIKKVKEYLEQGNYITDVIAAKLVNSYRLSAIIYELRHRYNLNVQDEWVVNHNTHTKYKKYWLIKKD